MLTGVLLFLTDAESVRCAPEKTGNAGLKGSAVAQAASDEEGRKFHFRCAGKKTPRP